MRRERERKKRKKFPVEEKINNKANMARKDDRKKEMNGNRYRE